MFKQIGVRVNEHEGARDAIGLARHPALVSDG
jgi:hypothetical protein